MAVEELTAAAAREQTRARYPDERASSSATASRVFYEVYGDGEPTILLLPTWSIIHSRCWKAQIPYLARHFRVVTFDGARQRPSDRPSEPEAYAERRVRGGRARGPGRDRHRAGVLVVASRWAPSGRCCSRAEPSRSASQGVVFIGPALPLAASGAARPRRAGVRRARSTPTRAGRSTTATTGSSTTRTSSSSSSRRCFTEPHSTKQIEDAVGWGLETDAETLVATAARARRSTRPAIARAGGARCAARCW